MQSSFLLVVMLAGAASAGLSPTEQLYFTTVRLETWHKDAQGHFIGGWGTGFFYRPSQDPGPSNPSNLLWIVTNKHVLFQKAFGLVDHIDCDIHEDHTSLRAPSVLGTKRFSWSSTRVAANQSILFHPDNYVDLIAIKFLWPDGGDGWKIDDNGNKTSHVQPIVWDQSHIATNDELFDEVVGGDNVMMYGYPHLLFDVHHKLPVVRAGYLAIPAYIDYSPGFFLDTCNCKPPPPIALGVVDMACFPGSSGSPVVLVDGANPRLTRDGHSTFGKRRLRLLGVAFGTIFRKVLTHIKDIPLTGDVEEDLHVTFYWKAHEISKLRALETDKQSDEEAKKKREAAEQVGHREIM